MTYNAAFVIPYIMRPQLLIRKFHKWLGLILGLQILLWFFSGFMMSWMPINEIRGNHLMKPQKATPVSMSGVDLASIERVVAEPIHGLQIKPWLGNTVLQVTTESQKLLFDAQSLQRISPLSEQQVRAVIQANLLPQYQISSMVLLNEVPNEARGRQAPLWQVQLSGDEQPRIYVSAATGDVVAKRTSRWRLFDFLWMLHIMDYDEREDFNHPLLYLTALSALLFTFSGFFLLFYSLRKRPKRAG